MVSDGFVVKVHGQGVRFNQIFKRKVVLRIFELLDKHSQGFVSHCHPDFLARGRDNLHKVCLVFFSFGLLVLGHGFHVCWLECVITDFLSLRERLEDIFSFTFQLFEGKRLVIYFRRVAQFHHFRGLILCFGLVVFTVSLVYLLSDGQGEEWASVKLVDLGFKREQLSHKFAAIVEVKQVS